MAMVTPMPALAMYGPAISGIGGITVVVLAILICGFCSPSRTLPAILAAARVVVGAQP